MCPLFFVVLLLVACFTPLRAASTNITYMKSNMEFIETPLPKDYVLPYTLERINSSTKENYSPDCLCLHFFNQALYIQESEGYLVQVARKFMIEGRLSQFSERATHSLDFVIQQGQRRIFISLFAGLTGYAETSIEVSHLAIDVSGQKATRVRVDITVSLAKLRIVATLFQETQALLQRQKVVWYPRLLYYEHPSHQTWYHCDESLEQEIARIYYGHTNTLRENSSTYRLPETRLSPNQIAPWAAFLFIIEEDKTCIDSTLDKHPDAAKRVVPLSEKKVTSV